MCVLTSNLSYDLPENFDVENAKDLVKFFPSRAGNSQGPAFWEKVGLIVL